MIPSDRPSVKGFLLPIDVSPAAAARAQQLGAPTRRITAMVRDLNERLDPPARSYTISGLPWPCEIQINDDTPPDRDRIRELIEMELAEVKE